MNNDENNEEFEDYLEPEETEENVGSEFLDEEPEELENDDVEEEYDVPNRKESFGEKEYREARDEHGNYDKDYYKNKTAEAEKNVNEAREEKNKNYKNTDNQNVQANGANTVNKNFKDKAQDNYNLLKAKGDLAQNKLNDIKSRVYQATHPGEVLKNKAGSVGNNLKDAAKSKAKEVGKKAGEAILTGAKALLKFLMKNPVVLIVLAILALLIFIILLLVILFGGSLSDNDSLGYFDSSCNFNTTTVELTTCNTQSSTKMSLKNYVIGVTSYYTKDNNYSDEVIKALMIVIKTNALSNGMYNNSSKLVTLDDCNMGYEEVTDNSSLNDLYDEVENYIFVSESYQSAISNLSTVNALDFDANTLSLLSEETGNYEDLLNSVYGGTGGTTSSTTSDYRDTLFLGDSRMQGILNANLINKNNTVYGVGYGYDWLVGNGSFDATNTNSLDGGIKGINTKIRQGASYNIVIWLGVNDYSINDANKYYQKYVELASGDWSNHIIYVVSVGPVMDERSFYATNSEITNFNNEMQSLINNGGVSNLRYIDLNYSENSIREFDSEGIHYSDEDYKNIYNIMTSNLENNLSSKKVLYNLSSYCTYYNLTENDSWWWPIGSKNPTAGDIYGGDPMDTVITSVVGPRNTGIPGASTNHGGVDIASSLCSEVPVIATKDGTVIYTNDGCVQGNSSCGSGFGNWVEIDHGDNIVSIYGHMSINTIQVKVGDTVKQGQILGRMGSTGTSSGCHLHFEMRINNSRVDPLQYVDKENPRPINTYNFDFNNSGNNTGGKQAVCQTLSTSGLSTYAIAGIMINLEAESSYRTNNLEGCYESGVTCHGSSGRNYGWFANYCGANGNTNCGSIIGSYGSDQAYTLGVDSGEYTKDKFMYDHAGYGLCQWTSQGRKALLYDRAKSENVSIASLDLQMKYLFYELENNTKELYSYLQRSTSTKDIALKFCNEFENPGSSTCTRRVTNSVVESMNSYVTNGCN